MAIQDGWQFLEFNTAGGSSTEDLTVLSHRDPDKFGSISDEVGIIFLRAKKRIASSNKRKSLSPKGDLMRISSQHIKTYDFVHRHNGCNQLCILKFGPDLNVMASFANTKGTRGSGSNQQLQGQLEIGIFPTFTKDTFSDKTRSVDKSALVEIVSSVLIEVNFPSIEIVLTYCMRILKGGLDTYSWILLGFGFFLVRELMPDTMSFDSATSDETDWVEELLPPAASSMNLDSIEVRAILEFIELCN
ncbi:hypothetical protein Tco_1034525 [Tanacetum coccineum]